MQDAVMEAIGPVDLNKCDAELGEWMVAAWIGMQAEKHGIPLTEVPNKLEWAAALIGETARLDSDNVESAALESAFRKACAGNYEAAGRMLRGYILSSAYLRGQEKFANEALRAHAKKRIGSKRGAEANKASAATWRADCVSAAKELLRNGRQKRELAGILSTRFSRTPRQIRAVLKKAELT